MFVLKRSILISIVVGSNRWQIRSDQKCYLCLRYNLLPMCPGWTHVNMVRDGGLEPPHLAAYAPQAYVSTSSTNRAQTFIYSEALKTNQMNV